MNTIEEVDAAHTFYEITGPEAQDLVDINGILADLKFTKEFLNKHRTAKDPVVQAALFSAATIAYRRCFTSGTRKKLTKNDIAGLITGATDYHEFVMAQASTRIAHSIRPHDVGKVGIAIRKSKIEGVRAKGQRIYGYEPEAIKDWNVLLDLIIQLVKKRTDSASDKVREIADATPISEITQWPVLKIDKPRAKNVN